VYGRKSDGALNENGEVEGIEQKNFHNKVC
jgi:hypothetical protein